MRKFSAKLPSKSEDLPQEVMKIIRKGKYLAGMGDVTITVLHDNVYYNIRYWKRERSDLRLKGLQNLRTYIQAVVTMSLPQTVGTLNVLL